MRRRFRIGTRGSPLALAQTEWVIARLQAANRGCEFEPVVIKTEGDLDQETPLPQMGGRGVFVRAVEHSLLSGEIDFAVHSLKDLPAREREGLLLAAVPHREDPRDALVTADGLSYDQLPEGALVGTGSPRRQAQLMRDRKDLRFRPLRGNVETRAERVLRGELDATILAVAGLKRTKLRAPWTPIPLNVMLPAPCQGALALQVRAGDQEALAVARAVEEPEARAAVDAERRLLAMLGAGCHAPVGIYCRREPGSALWVMDASVLSADGAVRISARQQGLDPEALSLAVYAHLKEAGVERLLTAE